ncbi:hypothetical protein [Actinomadura madurae]|uniref:hypothetical protein n=1 Tax=Actinomadura madurae TaxID=1993 RepID=UPI0020274066|nr:hypothetical protein [Actinomadura madurae]MCP9952302.1 hypothetical protein [Actinomadura madurae]MCP9969070.1 hypothetical protein [Actinomadura madurae]MCP9981541.1 hypothetical protein [Actinomadura madurae]MCQ0006949.1 hypothetical protein [Actinomadura madurae]MCQ0017740.1 hypothetical protein [Actinomadura madurae]
MPARIVRGPGQVADGRVPGRHPITAGDEKSGSTRYATWYSPCDGLIIPYTSTRLDSANNHYVACQTHIGFLADSLVLGAIAQFTKS